MADKKKEKPFKIQKFESSIDSLTKFQDAIYPKEFRVFETMNLLNMPHVQEVSQRMKSITQALEALRPINFLPEGMLNFLERMSQFQKTFRSVIPEVPQYLQGIGAAAFSIKERLEHINEEQKKTVEKCMEHGWYPIVSMGLTYISEEKDFEITIEKYIDKKTDEIERNLQESNPNRSDIIKDAFDAHRSGKYTLSIPALLAQADGICFERLGISPFSKKSGSQLQDKIPNELYTDFLGHYFQPVIFSKTIRANTNEVPPATLNRHHVLHGISTEYATRQNSLKAISYIGSLDWLLRELEESKKGNSTSEPSEEL